MSEHDATTLWALRVKRQRVACRARFLPNGIEVEIQYNNSRLHTQIFDDPEAALNWADSKRLDWIRRRPTLGR